MQRATRQDVAVLAPMLARAFADEPLHQWLFPDPDSRMQRSQALFHNELGNVLRNGLVLTSDDRRSAALWGMPGRSRASWWTQLVVTLTLAKILGLRARVVLRELQVVSAMRPVEAHWYLSVIGTDPSARNLGLATRLMYESLEYCDRDGTGAWLETSGQQRGEFYAQFGFHVRDRVQLAGGPEIIGMWRPPAVRNKSS